MATIILATQKPFAASAVLGMKRLAADGGHQLDVLEGYGSPEELMEALENAHALIVRSDIVDQTIIEAGSNLKIIVRAGAGYDNISLEAATSAKVCVMNTPGQNANAVAEMVFGAMVYQSRNRFDGTPGTELLGKKLGLIGLGNIGKRMAVIARGFEMSVFVYELYPNADQFKQLGIAETTTEAIFSTCHFVSLHVPSTPETKGMVDKTLLKSMMQGAMLVNAARQDLVNERDLAEVMSERTDLSFVTDFVPKDEALLSPELAARVFYPPKKMGAQTAEANVNAGMAAVRQIIRFLESGDETYKVN